MLSLTSVSPVALRAANKGCFPRQLFASSVELHTPHSFQPNLPLGNHIETAAEYRRVLLRLRNGFGGGGVLGSWWLMILPPPTRCQSGANDLALSGALRGWQCLQHCSGSGCGKAGARAIQLTAEKS